MQAGQQQPPSLPDPIALLEQKVADLEQWAGDTAQLIDQIHPAMGALLVPIAQAGKAMQQTLAEMRERGGGSPTVQPGPPMNPAEGAPVQPAVA